MFEKYFSSGPKVLFSPTEQERAKGNTFDVAPIQTSLDCCPAVVVIRQNTVFEHLKSLVFLLKY